MSRGDFFLCSSEEQRNFYLGFLTALGRVNPERLERDRRLAAPAVAVEHRLQVHFAHALQGADEKGVDRHQFSAVVHFDLPFPELGAEALQ